MSQTRRLAVGVVVLLFLGSAVLHDARSASADGITAVTPNGPYVTGLNAVVVQADRPVSPAEVVVALQRAAPGTTRVDLWVLARGGWLNYHPSAPAATQLGNFGTLTVVFVTLRPAPFQ